MATHLSAKVGIRRSSPANNESTLAANRWRIKQAPRDHVPTLTSLLSLALRLRDLVFFLKAPRAQAVGTAKGAVTPQNLVNRLVPAARNPPSRPPHFLEPRSSSPRRRRAPPPPPSPAPVVLSLGRPRDFPTPGRSFIVPAYRGAKSKRVKAILSVNQMPPASRGQGRQSSGSVLPVAGTGSSGRGRAGERGWGGARCSINAGLASVLALLVAVTLWSTSQVRHAGTVKTRRHVLCCVMRWFKRKRCCCWKAL